MSGPPSASEIRPSCDAAGTLRLDDLPGFVAARVCGLGGCEDVPLAAASGRVLARDIAAPMPLPPFDHAAVDGYALGEDVVTPALLSVAARSAAGGEPAAGLGAAEACRIFTGAPLPQGCASVVMQEHVRREGGGIVVSDAVRPGANIRRRGEDIAEGMTVLERGARLDARHVAVLAALGFARAPVARAVRAAILACGDELRAPGEARGPTQIYDSNSAMARAFLTGPGVEIVGALRVGDDRAALTAALARLGGDADLIVTSGGMSAGDHDHMRPAVAAAGGAWEPLRLAIKPGKPVGFGRIGGAVVLGLPGNPFAALTALALVGRLILRRLAGAPGRLDFLPAKAAFSGDRRAGRTELFPARIVGHDGHGACLIDRLGKGGSARLLPVVGADGLGRIEAETAETRPGDALRFLPFADLLAP